MSNNVVSLEEFKKRREGRGVELNQAYQQNKELTERIERIASTIQRINFLMKELRETENANLKSPKE